MQDITDRVVFGRGYDICIMGIDGTWRRNGVLRAISDVDALLDIDGTIEGLNIYEFFLLLSSNGLAYRRCELIGLNGSEMIVRFIRGTHRRTKTLVAAEA